MLALLQLKGKATERKCRMLMCALARSLGPALADERSRKAVDAAEAFADGLVALDSLREAATHAQQAHQQVRAAFIEARRATGGKYRRDVKDAVGRAIASAVATWASSDDPLGFENLAELYPLHDPLGYWHEGAAVDRCLQKHYALVFELFGNPFSMPWVDPSWVGWQDGLIPRMATAI
jgi:hypothetical protein